MGDGELGNMTRRQLAEAINGRIGFSKELAGEIVDVFFDQIKGALLSGEEVKLVQFGAFKVRDKSPRVGRNPKTGEEMEISPRRMVSFKPSRLLRDKINRDDD